MSNPIAVILRFNGDPDDLLERFEQARKSWSEAHSNGYSPPILFATCKADEGIVLITGWEAAADHKTFRKQMMPCLHAAGVGRPTAHEHLEIARLGCPSALRHRDLGNAECPLEAAPEDLA